MCTRWWSPARTCMRGASAQEQAAARAGISPTATGAVGRPWVWEWTAAGMGWGSAPGRSFTAGGKISAHIAHAYLMPLPTLSVLRSGGDVMVFWPSVDTVGFALEQAYTLAPLTSWVSNTASITDDGTNKSLTLPATNSAQFF